MNGAQKPDTKPGPYYISVVKDGDREKFALVSGPYNNHADALALVDKARRVSEDKDPRAVWYAFGTVRMDAKVTQPGVLQKWGFGLDLETVPA